MRTAKYFTATWCGPCKAFKPVMNEIKSEGYSIEIIDLDSNQALANQYNVRSVPTTVIEEKGVEVASRALNHSDTQVTRDHYIVPEEKDLEFEFEDKKSNVENIDKHRLEKVKKLK